MDLNVKSQIGDIINSYMGKVVDDDYTKSVIRDKC